VPAPRREGAWTSERRGAALTCYSGSLPPTPQGMSAPLLATVAGLCGAALGLWLTAAHRRSRILVPFSAGVLLGVALFGLLPELILEIGAAPSLALFGSGYALLIVVNRYAYPVCPTCSHDHDHNTCSTELHGFAVPLIAAAAVHSFLDGWSVATAQLAVPLGLRVAVPLAVVLHKIPEGIALGAILRVSVQSRAAAAGWCALAEGTTALGGAAGLLMAPHLGSKWITYPLGVAAGWLFYLGFHAVHEEWKRRGAAPAFASAVTGVAGAALVQRGVEALFR
jgi:zinc transporter ZupT